MIELDTREDRPARIDFFRQAVEDVVASRREGRYIAKDVDMVKVTPMYGRGENVIYKIPRWKEQMRMDVDNGRMPKQWMDRYLEMYEAWLKGQTLPLNGSPIKGWGVISPAQQETLLRMGILTVEDLAAVNDEGIRNIGMGAIDIRNKARAWIAELKEKGAATQEVAALKKENEALRSDVHGLQEKLENLISLVNEKNKESVSVTVEGITADELLETEERTDLREQYIKLYGKPPHHLMKTDTIRKRIEAKQ